MTTETATSLRLTRVIPASPEEVFHAWTDPDELEQWYCPEGGTVSGVEVDLRVGGRFRLTMNMPNGAHTAYGVYRVIDRPRKLSFTWNWESKDAIGETLVTVELHPQGDATEVVFTHEGFPGTEDRDNHQQGWESCLNRLEVLYR